ncbi:Protein BZZ1 [Ophidiomyces ophidiicola]|uniref:Protein BZZ1 n=1 Tax=Ophidiomyces ophidiicola TaxID=1387563 RepID=A0ACB8UNR5_9EURO|nr:Protein BZZ1 [Ophidiomyces ophidiicola]KAI1906154.1 Protein BZZ1 [Ophidiomyces ophidiicola]KAI1911010.1 Protein BZZ1 [Ophidiomyces ophidiicola]KAI1927460.1 Protein BZZ1 [Ophidiomyces ophidiicola]KAI1947736.1 Protein BZZ1 [Ophidiomyces ophidiicola]KAI1950523.1 Protein BZZ1 [Ophidiomyces ophidiicola]
MAQVEGAAPLFGAELRDAFKPVNAWVSNGIGWLDEIQQFYRERSAIEKEYASKLTALCRKYQDRKSKKSSSLSVGDTPALTPGSLESASLTTWTTQLSAIEAEAAERHQYGADLEFRIAEPLKLAAARYDELRKNHVEWSGKLEKERDASYSDLKKSKGKYDGVCQEVENRRKKMESAFDHGKAKSQNAYQQQILEMNNIKNTYLIAINVTNKLKETYYYEYVPELLNGLQDLNETRVAKLNSIWTLAAQLEQSLLSKSSDHVSHVISEIPRNEPHLDSMMFIRHNVASWQEPMDMQFEPSPVWHDDATMAIDEPAKVFLRNTLTKSKVQMKEMKIEADKKRREVENAKKVRQSVRDGKDKRDEVEVVRAIFSMQEDLHQLDRKRLTAEVETSTITSVVGDLSFGAKSHNFRAQTFKIPTNCDLCGDRIWGLSAKGFDCRDCGYTCHSKCEMKVAPECPGEQTKEEKKKLKTERQEAASAARSYDASTSPSVAELPALKRRDTMNSLSSGYAASAARSTSALSSQTTDPGPAELPATTAATSPPPANKPATLRKHRVVAPPPERYVSSPPPVSNGGSGAKADEPKGKLLYPYQANGEDEISVEEGQSIVIVEPDDGSGWMRIRAGRSTGLVPASYVEQNASGDREGRPESTYSASSLSMGNSKRRGPAVAPKRGAKKLQYVVALYDYEARTEAEWSMAEGDRFVLVNRDGGNGWADVEKGGVTKCVPANYIDDAA